MYVEFCGLVWNDSPISPPFITLFSSLLFFSS